MKRSRLYLVGLIIVAGVFVWGLAYINSQNFHNSVTANAETEAVLDLKGTQMIIGEEFAQLSDHWIEAGESHLVLRQVGLENLSPVFAEGFTRFELEIISSRLLTPGNNPSLQVVATDSSLINTFTLQDGITLEAAYQPSKNRTLGEDSIPIKQTLTFNNPTLQDYDLRVIMRTFTGAEEVSWDGKEYPITAEPLQFAAYEKTASVTEFAQDIGQGDLEGLEHFAPLQHTYTVGSFLTYLTPDGDKARFDWSDVQNLNHEVTVVRQDEQSVLTLVINDLALTAEATLVIDPEYDLNTGTSSNIRYDGQAAGDNLAFSGALAIGDVNGDGLGDLVLGAPNADNNGRSNSGSAYVMFSTLIDDEVGTGNTKDLNTGTSYNIRYDGQAANDNLTIAGALAIGDLNGDGLGDLVLDAWAADNNSRSNSGSVWVMFSTLIDDVGATTGNDKDLATGTNYNIRYDGQAADDRLARGGVLAIGDLNGDGLGDLVLGAYGADNNSRSSSGSVWVMFSTLIDDEVGTGNNKDLNTGTSYNIRYDGQAASDNLTRDGALVIGDMNGDNLGDLVLGAYGADNNSRSSSGSVWVMFSTLIDDEVGTGNNKDLNTGTNYNIRYDGQAAGNRLTRNGALVIGDVNGDGLSDLVLGAPFASNNSRSSSGSAWVMFSTLIDDEVGTGNNKDLNTGTNYNIRYDGQAADDDLTNLGALAIGDLNGDSFGDLVLGAYLADNNSRSASGSAWVMFSTLIDDEVGTGNNKDLNTGTNYNIRYDGQAADDWLAAGGALVIGDLNGDGLGDLVLGALAADNNSRSDSGSAYVMFSTLIDDEGVTTGNDKDLATSTNYNIRYDGQTASDQLTPLVIGDMNGDSLGDLVLDAYLADNNSRSASGSAWIILAVAANTAPTAPTTLYSNNTDASSGDANPTEINDQTPVFSAICNDPDSSDVLDKYRIQVDDDSDFLSTVWNTNAAGTSMANCTEGNRSTDVEYAGTTIELDGTLYYWRIKFWDDDNTEGAWSTGTNTFTMILAATSPLILQQQAGLPATPLPDDSQALDSSTVQWNFQDTSVDETGFKLVDKTGEVILTIEEPDVTSIEQADLEPNTLYIGLQVVAFNDQGDSIPSDPLPDVVTLMPDLTPAIAGVSDSSLTVETEEAIPNLIEGQSAVEFELMYVETTTSSVGAAQVLSSGWIQEETYTFADLDPDREFQTRVRGRNQAGVESAFSPFSEPTSILGMPIMNLGFDLRLSDGSPLPAGPISPYAVLHGSVSVSNTGNGRATNVLANVLLPNYIVFIPNSLQIDGSGQTAAADVDVAQANGNAVSAIWDIVNPGEEHMMTFQLGFDIAALQILAAVNPRITLQATLSYNESPETIFSDPVTVEPDLSVLAPPPEEEVPPEVPPEPEEIPILPPTPEEVVVIEEILKIVVGAPPAAPPPEEEKAETKVQSDGQSFTLEVSLAEEELIVMGFAFVEDDQIEFTGTTSEPFAIVTLIFNDNVTVLATSNANGEWQTFVSGEQLGIKPGQTIDVGITAIAAKGELRSERVKVAEVTVTRAAEGLVAEFETLVAESEIVAVVKQIQKEVVVIIEEQEEEIQTTLVVAAPVVIVSSAPLWGYLPYIPTLIYHLITYLVGAVGRKKRKKRFYGVVYDSITKEPLSLAILRIYNKETNKLVATKVTDKQGRYDVLLEPGTYRLEVKKPQYSFPSKIVTTEIDGDYQNIYKEKHGMSVETQDLASPQEVEITIPDIPLDPINIEQKWQVSSGIKKVWMSIQKVGQYLAAPLLIVGSAASVLVVLAIPENPVNWVLAVLYVLMLVLQLKLRPKLEKAWGVVYEIASNAALPLATIQLIDPEYGKIVKSRLSDYQGRFSFMPEPGKYTVKANKDGYEQIEEVIETPQKDRRPMEKELTIEKPDQRITGDVPMKRQDSPPRTF